MLNSNEIHALTLWTAAELNGMVERHRLNSPYVLHTRNEIGVVVTCTEHCTRYSIHPDEFQFEMNTK